MIESIFMMFVPGIRLMFGLGFWAAALPYIATAISAAGLGLSASEQKKARKEAKEAAEKQRKQDAWENLMSAAGGQGLARAHAIEAPPAYNLGPSVSTLGSTAMSYAQKSEEQKAQRTAKAEEVLAKQKADSEAQERRKLGSLENYAKILQGDYTRRKEYDDVMKEIERLRRQQASTPSAGGGSNAPTGGTNASAYTIGPFQ